MAFSFFRRKGKETDRDRTAGRDAVPAAAGESGPDTIAARRRAARLTEEKIDRIESEMIAASRSGAPVTEASAAPALEGRRTTVVGTQASTEWLAGLGEGLAGRSSAIAIDINASSLPGALEEAAIQFASGQSGAAAETLRQALSDADLGGFRQLAWLMLLDLHQFAGEKERFEALALEYAARFESSPPHWADNAAPDTEVDRPGTGAVVALPARIDDGIASRLELIARGMERGRETVMDFGPVQAVDHAGAARLLALLRRFENAPSRYALVVREPGRLFDAARAAIEPGRHDESDACWMLALFSLRLLGEAQRFEDLGIEYCVTYEVSPPSWERLPRSIRVAGEPSDPGQPGGPATTLGPATSPGFGSRSGPDTVPRTAPAGLPPAEPNAFVLTGEIGGRMLNEAKALRAFAAGRSDVVVDCRALRRIEFAAVGELLNEIVTLRTAGKQVLLVEPNRLVYALLLVMGIQELAEIRQRRI